MMMGLLGEMVAASNRFKSAQYQAELMRYQNALKNIRDYHGFDPHPHANMIPILRDYSVPWRKTTIPHAGHRKETP